LRNDITSPDTARDKRGLNGMLAGNLTDVAFHLR